MNSQVVTLSNKNPSVFKQDRLQKFYQTELLTDITLISEEGENFNAHRLILASSSEVFEKVFKNVHQARFTMYMNNVRSYTLRRLMNFIYTGNCHVAAENLETFLAIAGNLKVDGLFSDVQKTPGIKKEAGNGNDESEEIDKVTENTLGNKLTGNKSENEKS